jgi:hypothetical protein
MRATTYYDYLTIKYDSSGTEEWVARYNGPANDWDRSLAIHVDSSGYVYVTGTSFGTGTDYDYCTIKYDSLGTEMWTARYNGSGNDEDYPETINVDGSGNVYITGNSAGGGLESDITTIKYNSSGTELWVTRFDGPGHGSDFAYDLILDLTGNIYIAGGSYGFGTDFDYTILKYSNAGKLNWVSMHNGSLNAVDHARIVKTDLMGNVYATGTCDENVTMTDYVTMKLVPSTAIPVLNNRYWHYLLLGTLSFVSVIMLVYPVRIRRIFELLHNTKRN